MLWINFIHLYQPANTKSQYIEEAVDLSYQRLLQALKENSRTKFTININGCLIERLFEMGRVDIISGFKDLISRGQLEIVSTAAYHPVLPLISKQEMARQIKEQEKILHKYLGVKNKPKGFFLPEMAYSPQVSKVLASLGYKWIILDEIAFKGKIDEAEVDKVYQDKYSGLKIIFRSRRQSNTYVPDLIIKNIKSNNELEFFMTATDAELYGLRHQDPTGELEKVLSSAKVETQTISEYLKNKPVIEIKPLACSWESLKEELQDNQPYILWNGRNNKIQASLWKLANLALTLLENNPQDKNYAWARWHLVRGLASCTFWWASAKDFKHNFGPYAWNPDETERGLEELIRSVRSLESESLRKYKLKAENLYIQAKALIWKRHWQYYWKK
ncbi:MAG: polysaccharide deacetylase family protein [Candidatus Pacebacteria bacterium]|nr:polysaccharide deacetylase family protein [Candidatus Paceibacterota bacterium]